MRSPSDPGPPKTSSALGRPARKIAAILLVVTVVTFPAAMAWADVISTSIYLLGRDSVQDEDAYVVASSARIDGTVDGDLVIATGALAIDGTVTGDVLVLTHGTVSVTGRIDGSLRGAARQVRVTGSIGDDVAVATFDLVLGGDVERDAVGLAGRLDLGGVVGRDVLGRFATATVGGAVGRDVEVAVGDLTVTRSASVGNDIVYRSGTDLVMEPGATVGGQVVKVPARTSFFVGVVLRVVQVLGFLGFVAGGIVLLWLLRDTGERAVAVVAERPWLTIGVGLGTVVAGPVVLAFLVASLVGVPLALLVLLAMLAGLLFGAVPLATAVGRRLLGDRGGLFAGFVVGAVLWSVATSLVPILGAALYIVGVVWGIGGWLTGAWQVRRMRVSGPLAGACLLLMAACGSADRAPEAPAVPSSSLPVSSSVTTTQPTTSTLPATSAPAPSEAPGSPLSGTTIVLDPGHNGRNWAHPDEINRPVDIGTGSKPCNTTGAQTADGYAEATFTWEVALRARRQLEGLGATVVLTRRDNDGWGPCITERAAIANAAGAAAAISIHADGAAPDVRGFHVIYPDSVPGLTDDIVDESTRLAAAMRDAYLATGVPPASYTGTDGLDQRSDLGGLTLSDVPAVFLEAGNMRNPTDAELLADPEFQELVASAIVEGLSTFLGS